MSENMYCPKCGSKLLEAGGRCNLHTVKALPNPPTPKFRDSFKNPTKALTPKQLEARKKALKDLNLNELLSKMRYPEDTAGTERMVRGTSSAVWSDVPEEALQKGDHVITTRPGTPNTGTKEVFAKAAKLIQEGKRREEIEAALEQEFGIDPDEPELIKMIVNSAIEQYEDEGSETLGPPERPDEPALMKATGIRPSLQDGRETPPNWGGKGTNGTWPNQVGNWTRSKAWNVPVHAARALDRQLGLKPKSIINLGGGKTVGLNWLIEKTAHAYDSQSEEERLLAASVLEEIYAAGYFPEDILSNRANIYLGVELPKLIVKLVTG